MLVLLGAAGHTRSIREPAGDEDVHSPAPHPVGGYLLRWLSREDDGTGWAGWHAERGGEMETGMGMGMEMRSRVRQELNALVTLWHSQSPETSNSRDITCDIALKIVTLIQDMETNPYYGRAPEGADISFKCAVPSGDTILLVWSVTFADKDVDEVAREEYDLMNWVDSCVRRWGGNLDPSQIEDYIVVLNLRRVFHRGIDSLASFFSAYLGQVLKIDSYVHNLEVRVIDETDYYAAVSRLVVQRQRDEIAGAPRDSREERV